MTEIKWRDYAACKNAPYSLFTSRDGENEPSYPPKQALEYCNRCSVNPECLATALANNETGVWGGTSTYQRTQMKRVRARLKCPSCESLALVIDKKVELCLACGISWRTQTGE